MTGPTASVLRPITAADHPQVLTWNHEHVELLSELDEPRLVTLLGWTDRGSVIVDDGRDVGFVLTFPSGTAYDSVNYRWFSERYRDFYYLDRVVVDPSVRRTGVGTRLYDEIEARARALAPVMCLEVNLDPPNEPSLAFHRRRGFVEVGQDDSSGHRVSLMVKDLGAVS
ncbi:MAG TPA: GNAT family N-acetyltransferase [Marmoricola sp.]|nr:GNAT family N-acetyltransferase [Marmoricola sp.]